MYSMDLRLKGKAALVTGASEGIGTAIARKLADEGVRVAICARTESKLKEAAAEIARATGVEVVPIPADLRTLAGCQGFVEQAANRLGSVDILVNNAGASAFGAFVDLPDDAFVDAINGKLLGYIRCAKAAIAHMRRRGGGVIVNITGTTQQAVALHTPGSACNAAIRMFSKELSIELGPLNIRVNSVAPGRIQTARSDRLLHASAAAQGMSAEAALKDLVRTIPSGRLGSGDDIADAVCFLVSDRASYVNGAALVVDGSKSVVI
jgi:3-oxoacyl-[acyl-carrier protein] reductase